MSIVESSLSWVRNQVGWSNSRQSWEERISALALLLAALGMAWKGAAFPASIQVVVWGGLILAAALLLRRGWLKLFGPVLFFDMLCLARRSRYFWLRMGYALLLILFLFMSWGQVRGMDRQHEYSMLAEIYFTQFMFIQLIAVSVLTPAYVAGSIAEEKDRKTLEFMLATDLRNREIVLSKLFARLGNLTLFILTGLPILSILQFLGGVDPNLVLAGFWTTFMTMFGLGGFSILSSVQMKKPRDAIAVAYLGPLVYIAIGLVVWVFQLSPWFTGYFGAQIGWWSTAPTVGELVNYANSGNLVFALVEVVKAIERNTLQTSLPQIVWNYSAFHIIVGLGCTTWAVVRLRAIALQQSHGMTQKAEKRLLLRPPVGMMPMWWKEVYVEGNVRFNWLARVFVAMLFVCSVGGGLWGIGYALWEGAYFDNPRDFYQGVNMYVRFASSLVASLMLLGVAVRASTAISSERDKDTMDSLLTTPLDSDTILWGKFWGCLFSMRRGLLWLGCIWLIGVVSGGMHAFTLPLVLLALFIYGAAFTILGLWFSMVSKTSMRATVWTVMMAVGISIGHWLPLMCCASVMFMHSGSNFVETLAKFQTGITPTAVLWVLPVEGFEFRHENEFLEIYGFCLFGMFLYAVASFFVWVIALSPRFRELTHREDFLYPHAFAAQNMVKYHRTASEPIELTAADEVPLTGEEIVAPENLSERPKNA